jgi:uroporphyrinogen-III synthase
MLYFKSVKDSICLEGVEYLLFTSKQAVKATEVITSEWKKTPSIVIGTKTAETVKALGGKVAYMASSAYGEVLVEEIVKRYRDRQILYLRPQEVSTDIKVQLALKGVEIKEEIIYKSECHYYGKNMQPERGAVIIFTSPLTLYCFLKQFSWDESYKAVAIGKQTVSHFPDYFKSFIAKEPTIEAAIVKAKEIQK